MYGLWENSFSKNVRSLGEFQEETSSNHCEESGIDGVIGQLTDSLDPLCVDVSR